MTVIIGIDPGSRITGYGIIRVEGNRNFYLGSGSIHLTQTKVAERLQMIFSELQKIISLYRPNEAAIEQVFMHANPGSALKLGQARGAAMVALNMPLTEYSARQVKLSVVGSGAAKKDQVQHMVKRLLNYSDSLQVDEADALAIALCHAHTRSALDQYKIKSQSRKRKTSWRNYQPV